MKKPIPKKLTFRLGAIREQVEKHLEQTEETPSQYLKRLICEDLGIDVPPDRRFNVPKASIE